MTFEHPHDLPDIVLETKAIAGWREADCKVSRLAGDAWLLGAEMVLLLVPSVVFDVEYPHDLPDIVLETKAIAGWREADCKVSRLAGDAWLLGAKTALLLVPSVVFDVCLNASINPAHAGSARIRVASVDPIRWAETLFSPGT